MNLDTAAIIGLSRQPLDEETQALAEQLMTQAGNPAEEALALLAAKSVAQRTNLPKSQVQEKHVFEEVPAHPSFRLFESHIFNYLEASLAFRGAADVKTLYDRGLVVPAANLPWFLEGVIRRANVEPEAYALLGRRGLWLSLKHPSFKRKVAFLQVETFPKSAKQREAYAMFWWSELLRMEQGNQSDVELINRFRKLITASKLQPEMFGRLQAALDKRVLAKALTPAQLLNLFWRKQKNSSGLTDLEILHIECLLDENRRQQMESRVREVLSELPAGLDHRDSFEVFAKAAVSSRNSHAAATLLHHASTSGDRLIKGQKSLPMLAAVLNESDYADLMDYAHDRYPKAWRDPMVVSFIAANPHPFSTKLSEEFVSEAIHGYAPPSETVLGRYPHKLNPIVLDHLLALMQDNQSETLNALLAMTLAKQRIDSAFPLVD